MVGRYNLEITGGVFLGKEEIVSSIQRAYVNIWEQGLPQGQGFGLQHGPQGYPNVGDSHSFYPFSTFLMGTFHFLKSYLMSISSTNTLKLISSNSLPFLYFPKPFIVQKVIDVDFFKHTPRSRRKLQSHSQRRETAKTEDLHP